jgi:mannitol 2-dehydrogenase
LAILSNASLDSIPNHVTKPRYDRNEVTPGIVHFGVGGFHRSHQAFTIDRLLSRGLAKDWGIIGVGLLPQDQKMRDVLVEQDGLYTLITKHRDGKVDYQIIGSLINYYFGPDDPEEFGTRQMD